MKKNVFIILGILSLIFLVSCNKDDTYEQSMKKAEEAISEKKFVKADGFIEIASESRPKDEKSRIFLKQIKLYLEALDNKKAKKNDKAINKFQEVIEITDGSDKLVSYAKSEKSKLEKIEKDEKKNKTAWNEAKSETLKKFMASFGSKMGQRYNEYNQINSMDFNGLSVPKDILSGKLKLAVNDQPVKVERYGNGQGTAVNQLVAVYADEEIDKHIYFFVIQNSIPKIWVTQQNQGNDERYLYVKETENMDLINGFNSTLKGEKIVKVEPVSENATTEEIVEETTEETTEETVPEQEEQTYTDISAQEFATLYAKWSGRNFPIMHEADYLAKINGKSDTNEEQSLVITYGDRDNNTLQCAVSMPGKMSEEFYTYNKQEQKAYLNHNTADYSVEEAGDFTSYIHDNM